MRNFLFLCVLFLHTIGCVATAKTERYMIAVEDNGQAALYRVTAEIKGGFGVRYKLSQGYVAANVADKLAGKNDDLNDLYAPASERQIRDTARQEMEKNRLEKLTALAKDDTADKEDILNVVQRYASIQSAAELSTNDQASVGITGSNDPYTFRKLVFIASTKVIDIQEYEVELNAIEKSIGDLATAIKSAREAKAAEAKAKRESRWRAFNSVIGSLQAKPDLTTWQPIDFLTTFGAAQSAFVTPPTVE